MKTTLLAAALSLVATAVHAHDTHIRNGVHYGTTHTHANARVASRGARVIASCYRGPWRNDVIWDRANPVFIQGLVNNGYSRSEAEYLANSTCRDASLIGNPNALARRVQSFLR